MALDTDCRQSLLDRMKAITDRARQEGCLLETRDSVYTPDDIDKRNRIGEFVWPHPANWTMVIPQQHLERAERQVDKALSDLQTAQNLVERLEQELKK